MYGCSRLLNNSWTIYYLVIATYQNYVVLIWLIILGGSGISCSCSAQCLILKYNHVSSSWCSSLPHTKLIKATYLNINKINGAIKQKKLYSTKSSLFTLLKKPICYSRDKEKQHKTSFESSEFLMCFPSQKREAFIEMLAV